MPTLRSLPRALMALFPVRPGVSALPTHVRSLMLRGAVAPPASCVLRAASGASSVQRRAAGVCCAAETRPLRCACIWSGTTSDGSALIALYSTVLQAAGRGARS
jgi:hypothetical protein